MAPVPHLDTARPAPKALLGHGRDTTAICPLFTLLFCTQQARAHSVWCHCPVPREPGPDRRCSVGLGVQKNMGACDTAPRQIAVDFRHPCFPELDTFPGRGALLAAAPPFPPPLPRDLLPGAEPWKAVV